MSIDGLIIEYMDMSHIHLAVTIPQKLCSVQAQEL